MAIYSDFAALYDAAMSETPYDTWTKRIVDLFGKTVSPGDLVCELGSGTGEITLRLSELGYDMIGIDNSEEMLNLAKDKLYSVLDGDGEEEEEELPEPPVLFLKQDMRSFELFGTVRAFVSVCDSLNYMENTEELTKVFRLVNNYLDKDGIFLFDVKTEYFFRSVCGNSTRTEEIENDMLIWENEYNPVQKKNHYRLTMFRETGDGSYRRSSEDHVQTAFSEEEIRQALSESGLILTDIIRDFREEGDPEPERLLFVAKEGYQEGKLY